MSRLASRFLDAIEQRQPVTPGFAEGYRAQLLLDAVRRSHALGHWIEIAAMGAPMSSRRILVTGGSGFIGSALVKALRQGRPCGARA